MVAEKQLFFLFFFIPDQVKADRIGTQPLIIRRSFGHLFCSIRVEIHRKSFRLGVIEPGDARNAVMIDCLVLRSVIIVNGDLFSIFIFSDLFYYIGRKIGKSRKGGKEEEESACIKNTSSPIG